MSLPGNLEGQELARGSGLGEEVGVRRCLSRGSWDAPG